MFLFLPLQSTKATRDDMENITQTLLYEFRQANRLIDLFLRLEMFVVYFPSSCEPQSLPSEETQNALSNNLRIRPW
jgi:hypothetical protein